MSARLASIILIIAVLCCLVSCSQVSKRMPDEIYKMHKFLTQENPEKCSIYHYNFERQTPRLYNDNQTDSILDVIDFIKTECGPTNDLEITRLLLLAEQGRFDDSLIGKSTIPGMIWYRTMQEYLEMRERWGDLLGGSQPIDNTHENFTEFNTELARNVSLKEDIAPTGRLFGLFYVGDFDSAFSLIQSPDFAETRLRKRYDNYIGEVRSMFPGCANVCFSVGSWIPRGNNKLLGNHPEIGFQVGGEENLWRADLILGYRFVSAKNKYQVDSLGVVVSTNKYYDVLIGMDAGLKFIDNSKYSADLFAGLGYDMLCSIKEAGDPDEIMIHGSPAVSIGLRQRIFLDQRNGMYLGGIIRLSYTDYSNSRGTDLSGASLNVSLICGWSFNETMNQFLRKLNYKGNWRK